MPLFHLINEPFGEMGVGDDSRRIYDFAHERDHQEIRTAIQSRTGINLPDRFLFPVDADDSQSWLERHQKTHDDMNDALALSGVDLQNVNFENESEKQAWTNLNYQEHLNARSVLSI